MRKIIAVVDDEEKIREIIKSFLHNEGYEVLEAEDGKEAIELADQQAIDLMLLDIMMPNMDGLQALREIRLINRKLPVIMLTAKSEEIDKLLGLEMGADDYMTKPFSMRELAARMRAVLRRSAPDVEAAEVDEIIKRGDIEINLNTYEAFINGETLNLTPTEYKILVTLAQKPGRVYSRLQLLDISMGEAFANYERSIDTHVSNLRKKVEKDPAHPEYIHTVYGMGYRFGDKK
ncbi:response regulator transcription factor [Bacillus benzoevorans]|uniref:Two-component system OmpR family response regulator n=1 Tax=Bacillus benzoevorans TaxID=1456 RepID=A0A7X0LUG9_9BACI|nr:response regulator transcription factor [Bacillus benzoevorans]MBB6444956.1 two-component system OmpR family response regulator [Bacillus benzoevorans]